MGITLEEYKNIMEASESDKEYICNWCKKIFYTEEQQDEFSIGFAEWLYRYDNARLPNGNWIIKLGLKPYTSKEVLEIYKKEKGL